jgi:SAM-dependent methyltransferase
VSKTSSPGWKAPDFQRYLAAKRTVDDRALNRPAWTVLAEALQPGPSVIEVGCGIGTMLSRMRAWGLLDAGSEYLGIDSDRDSIEIARETHRDPSARFECADFYARPGKADRDLMIAAAFLDLVDLDRALPHLGRFLKPGGLAYLPLIFDGVTVFEPAHLLDETVLAAYHASMDDRPSGGHSRTGRRLFRALPAAGFEILAAGASDWIVHPGTDRRYPADEAYFLMYILHFIEGSCADVSGVGDWLAERRTQIEAGELVYIAHQVDFLAMKKQPSNE